MMGFFFSIMCGMLIGIIALCASDHNYDKPFNWKMFLYFVMLQLLSFAVLLKSLKLLGIL